MTHSRAPGVGDPLHSNIQGEPHDQLLYVTPFAPVNTTGLNTQLHSNAANGLSCVILGIITHGKHFLTLKDSQI